MDQHSDKSENRNADKTWNGILSKLQGALVAGEGNVSEISLKFSVLKSNCARVDFAYKLLDKYSLFPRVIANGSSKDGKVAVRLREEGNDLFKIRKDELALMKYTSSIAYAEDNSKDLGLVYANRSAVLYEHGLYKECLEDISKAFSSKYPNHLHEKLNKRREKALLLQSKESLSNYHNKLPKLTFERNPLIECAGDCVEIKTEEKFGRHIKATRNIEVGDVIAIEKPFVNLLLKENYLTHCYNCLKPCVNLVPCQNCPLVLFCSDECKTTCWNAWHKYECPILATLLDLEFNKLVLIALKIVMIVVVTGEFNIDDSPKGSLYKSQNYYEIRNLVANTSERSTSDLFPRAVTAAIVFELVQKSTRFFEDFYNVAVKEAFKELLLLHMQTGPSNFHEISEIAINDKNLYEAKEFGVGAYGFLSLLNHSCSPNVVRHCYGNTIVLRALSPILKGEQLYDNYGYHYAIMPKAERHLNLRKQYFFECACQACLDSWPLYFDLPLKQFDISISEEEIDKLRRGNNDVAQSILPDFQHKAKVLQTMRPCRELADVQEIVKQCYAIFGNKRRKF